MRTGVTHSHRPHAFTVCVRDDDSMTYEFRTTHDASSILDKVAAAVADGRRVRYYILAADTSEHGREEQYLAGEGYARATVRL